MKSKGGSSMVEISGKKIIAIFGFYNILIDDNTLLDDKFIKDIKEIFKKGGIWLIIPENLYKKCNINIIELIRKEFTFYYNDLAGKKLIFVKSKNQSYPPAPNANIGTHVIIMSSDNNVLVTMEKNENNDSKISIPGGHMDLTDDGIENTLIREFGEEITKKIKINKNDLQLVLVRFIPDFPRLGHLYKNKDIWFLYKLVLSEKKIKEIILNYKKNNEVSGVKLLSIDELSKSVNWMTNDVVQALKNSRINKKESNKAYNDNYGFFFTS